MSTSALSLPITRGSRSMAGRVAIPRFRGDAMRLSDLAQKFLNDPRYITTARSRETYDLCLGQFQAYLVNAGSENSVSALTAENVEGFVAYLFERGLATASVNLRLSAIAGLAKYAMQTKDRGKYLLDLNPVDRVKRPRNAKPPVRYLALDDLRALLTVECPSNERLALALIVDQPLRATEYCEAKVRDLSPAGDGVALTVRVKGGRFVQKVLGDRVAAALLAALKEREAGPDEPLLVNAKGEPYTRQSLSEMIARNALRAGLTRFPVRAHVIRHSIASMAAAMGASEHELAAMLNHASLGTVKRYVHGVRPDAALGRVREALDT
jgi:site-specific recombinase XerD